MPRVPLGALKETYSRMPILSMFSGLSIKDIPCMFADFRNQVQENNFLLEVTQRTGGSMCSE
jgi:hypothetical protein